MQLPGDLSFSTWFFSGISAFLIGLSKSGFTGASIPVPSIMAALFPARASTGIILPILISADIIGVTYYRRHANIPALSRILPFALAGIIAGYFILGALDDKIMRPFLATLMLVLILLTILKETGVIPDERIPRNLAFAGVMGVLAGLTTMTANAAGPVMIVYLIAMNLEKREFIGTAAWFFFIVNLIKVPFSASLGLITSSSLTFDLLLFPAVLTGAITGIITVKMVSQKLFRTVVIGLAVVSSVLLFV